MQSRLHRSLPLVLIFAWLAPALAEDRPGAETRRLEEAEIRTLTAGKTFHYTMLGKPRGAEQHWEDGRAVWRLPDGLCLHGIWNVYDNVLCYYYGEFRYGCWHVLESGGTHMHAPLDLGMRPTDGPRVVIERISEEDVGCAPQQLASLP